VSPGCSSVAVELCPSESGVQVAPAFLRGLIDGMRCGIVSIDAAGRVVLVNDHARRILSIADADTGTPIAKVLAQHPRLAQVLLGSLHMSNPPNRAELELETGPPGGKVMGFTISVVRDADGSPSGVAMFFKDLTQIEHAEEQERLRDRLAALGQMASSLAHEIRNPLAAIEVSCQLLARRVSDDRACRDLLDKVTAEVRRVNATVTASLEFVRPVRPALARSDLVPLLEEALSTASKRRAHPGVRIEGRLEPEMPQLPMDRELLLQAFVNLILNAIEACGTTGRVTVEAGVASDASLIAVSIADTGPGVPEPERDQIFYPFYTTKQDGSGVGLALARKIVTAHGGVIEVRDAPEGGAEFLVRLPIAGPATVRA
jgi:two-component system, NtrC family, sensor histidine kinase AtoS